MRKALIVSKGWRDVDLPYEKMIGNILNRIGYCLRQVQKTKPIKNITGTDDIFNNLNRVNRKISTNPATTKSTG